MCIRDRCKDVQQPGRHEGDRRAPGGADRGLGDPGELVRPQGIVGLLVIGVSVVLVGNFLAGEIAAIFIEGEGTLKRLYWDSESESNDQNSLRLEAENENFNSMTITEENRKEVAVFGKYVGLVRGELRVL